MMRRIKQEEEEGNEEKEDEEGYNPFVVHRSSEIFEYSSINLV